MDSEKQNNLDVWTDDEDEILITKLLEIKTSLASGDSFSPSTSVSQESWRDIANEINKICPNSRSVDEVRNRYAYLHARFNELQNPTNTDERLMWGLYEKMRSLLGMPMMQTPNPSLDQSDIGLERKASRHWSYDEEKALIENILAKKRELGSMSAKLTLSAWTQVTDELNKSYSCSRSVEGIKKHYRKLRTKYLTEKSLSGGGSSTWAHYQKMGDIVENESDNNKSALSASSSSTIPPPPNTPSRMNNNNNNGNSPSLTPISSIYDPNQNRMIQTQLLGSNSNNSNNNNGNSDNIIQQITQCQEKQKRTYDQTVQLVDVIAKRIKYDIELENEFLEVLKKMISN